MVGVAQGESVTPEAINQSTDKETNQSSINQHINKLMNRQYTNIRKIR